MKGELAMARTLKSVFIYAGLIELVILAGIARTTSRLKYSMQFNPIE